MLLIPCPFCGDRNEDEFSYIGDANQRILLNRPLDLNAYAEHLYMRPNPVGQVEEYWYHRHGCQTIFSIRRNTKTHDITR